MHSLMRRDLTDIKKAVCINSDIIDQKNTLIDIISLIQLKLILLFREWFA